MLSQIEKNTQQHCEQSGERQLCAQHQSVGIHKRAMIIKAQISCQLLLSVDGCHMHLQIISLLEKGRGCFSASFLCGQPLQLFDMRIAVLCDILSLRTLFHLLQDTIDFHTICMVHGFLHLQNTPPEKGCNAQIQQETGKDQDIILLQSDTPRPRLF